MPNTAPCANWEFDGFQVLTELRLLLSDGTAVPLTSKAFDTLVLLIANRDRVVTKDELLRSVWPDVAVEEGNLTQQIFLLRKALGESAQQPRYIVTVPGHGYRFTARVKAISDDPATTGVATAGAASLPTASRRGVRSIGTGLVVFGIVALLAMVFGSGWMAVDKAGPPLDLTKARIIKITESGKATNSAISADGRYVAYVENDGDEYSVWVKQIATGGTTQVVPRQPQVLTHLSFSPDSEYLYFARGTPRRGGFVLSRVPVIGGLETPILDDVDTPVSFSPDGRQFVFTARRRRRVSHRHCCCRRRLSANSGDAKGTARLPASRAGLVPRRQGGGGVRDRSEQRLAVVHRSSPDRRRQQPRTLHDRQSHRPCPLAARRIGAADGRLGSADEAISTMACGRIRPSLGRGDLAHRVPRRSSRTPDVRSGRPRPLLPGHRRRTAARSRASSIRSCRTSGLRRPTTWTRAGRLPGATQWSRVTAGYRTTTRSCIAI